MRRGRIEKKRQRLEGCVHKPRNTQGLQQHQELKETRKVPTPLPQSLQKEPGPANTLVWELCPLDL